MPVDARLHGPLFILTNDGKQVNRQGHLFYASACSVTKCLPMVFSRRRWTEFLVSSFLGGEGVCPSAVTKFFVCFRRQYGILLFDEFYGRRRTEWGNN
ncbi:hypothetical protein CW755_13945 [Geobacillus thermodenitrificans]|jgi:hypothetical protein|uniref:Uncharacterized protein n=1 Tax=Geobacillus thermodenitrificans (strain NG80-2) TaxID=420246 RepID=A4ISR0_GEOTN|nr:hypothetical protein GTNG_3019 [Geobacillus thermodenitrificans NG80-2]ARA98513.1 hypothetical protein GD3902_10980 [Geobacillus thermodenitrificans]KQB92010.1 hypothetical protein GEPA3_3149 [Geobacillus sp. PA-3]NNU86155.1 hypothetical protein [Geobacillus sp. MR]OQP09799.1 hypothetical protein B1691_08940 [Geobacillus sp. 47C-IIb]